MNNFIQNGEVGIEVGAGYAYSKYILKKNDYITTDISNYEFLDYKNIDALDTKFDEQSFNYVIASNMIHHVSAPKKFFLEMHRILKKNGKLIIFEPNCSFILKLILNIMKHEGYDFNVDVWKDHENHKDPNEGNNAIPNLIFDNKDIFNEKIGKFFDIIHHELDECLVFLNSGGISSKTFYIPLSYNFLRILKTIDKGLVKIGPKFFALGMQIVMQKKGE